MRLAVRAAAGDGGAPCWIELTTAPLGQPSAPGSRVPVIATFSDVTAEQQATHALEASREQFRRAIEVMPGVLYRLELDQEKRPRFVFLSPRVREALGFDAELAVADPAVMATRIHPDDYAVIARALREASRTLARVEFDMRVRTRGESWSWIRNRITAERDGARVVWNGLALDVTEEHALKEQVRRAERREAIGTVTAGVAHNFNNALAVLLPNLEEALETAPPALRPLLEDAHRVARASAGMVEQLVTLVQERAATLEVLDLVALVGEVVGMCRRVFKGEVALETDIRCARAPVMGSPGQLLQVLLNLCNNARDALAGRKDGRLHLTLALEVVDGAEQVVLRIADNGSGMSPDVLARLGEPFFTTKRARGGTGLGLATAFASVAACGGTLTCSSTLGVGSEFVLRLPRSSAEPAPVAPPVPEPTRRGHILVVDDEPVVRSTMARILRRRHWAVDEAPGGDEALARLAAQAYDVVLLDLSMDGLSGERLFEAIERQRPGQPIIIVSGQVERHDCFARAHAVLPKPVAIGELLARLERLPRRAEPS